MKILRLFRVTRTHQYSDPLQARVTAPAEQRMPAGQRAATSCAASCTNPCERKLRSSESATKEMKAMRPAAVTKESEVRSK